MKSISRLHTLVVILAVSVCAVGLPKAERTVRLAAGSVNELARAVDKAGPGGTVILDRGLHTEWDTVVIRQRVTIFGLPGAVMQVGVTPETTDAIVVHPALWIRGASGTVVRTIAFRPLAPIGGTAVLVEDANDVTVSDNDFRDFQFAVLVQRGNDATLNGNTIQASTAWQTGEIPEADGIVVINGDDAEISRNTVSGAIFGLFCTGRDGRARRNETTANLVGLLLCHVPDGGIEIDGDRTGTIVPATGWEVRDNDSHDNLSWGYLVIDGANRNLMRNNRAARNAAYDIELAGETTRFGFLAPTTFENTVRVGAQQGLVIKDCGVNDSVDAPVVDTSLDPCN